MKLAIFSGLIVLILFGYQNCANQQATVDAEPTFLVTCSPASLPCLKYKISMFNQKDSKGGMRILVEGDANEGVGVNTDFSEGCNKESSTMAVCPLDTVISATIRSQDSRTLTVKLSTASGITSKTSGTLVPFSQ